jgi:hypothetical protein
MSGGYPIDPELAAALDGAMTISASPALVEDDTRPDIGPVAVLTMAPSITVHTSDDRPGAELVDVVASALLGMGFALVTAIESAQLAALPLLPDWRSTLNPTGNLLTIHEPSGMFYDGDLGRRPPGWGQTLQRRGQLVVLLGSTLALEKGDRYGQLTAASRAGEIVGAQLPLT